MRERPAPDFIVIGAMKCATTTLHEQLARKAGLFMSHPKEPNYFSDDNQYARGPAWYRTCFAGCRDDQLAGESSTHYTKMPTYPHTVSRMRRELPHVRLIYVMRHPIDRLASHYLHERTVGRVDAGLAEAVERHPELVAYGCYSRQLEPYFQAYGPEAILPVFFDRLVTQPQRELERIGRFLGVREPLRWDPDLGPFNVGRQRLRACALRNALVRVPGLNAACKAVIPRSWTERLKSWWRIGEDPPPVPPELASRLAQIFDEDLARLGDWLGVRLDCERFHEVARREPPREWAHAPR